MGLSLQNMKFKKFDTKVNYHKTVEYANIILPFSLHFIIKNTNSNFIFIIF